VCTHIVLGRTLVHIAIIFIYFYLEKNGDNNNRRPHSNTAPRSPGMLPACACVHVVCCVCALCAPFSRSFLFIYFFVFFAIYIFLLCVLYFVKYNTSNYTRMIRVFSYNTRHFLGQKVLYLPYDHVFFFLGQKV
jgi:hypothetical protein